MRIDLHIHSTASDGTWSPEAIVRGAAAGGLDVIAISDHDTSAAFARAEPIGREVDVQVIPAIEVSSTFQGRDVHVLGYFIDPEAAPLRAYVQRAGRRREERMREMIGRLAATGVEVTYDAVEAAAGPGRASIGRPHLAQALVAAGHVASVPEAFDALIGDDCEAFVATHLLDPTAAVELIIAGGGVPIWAHPPSDLLDTLLSPLLSAGLRGLEVYRPRPKRSDLRRNEEICRARGLLMSGGSDWHGPEGGSALGDFYVNADEIEALLAVGGL